MKTRICDVVETGIKGLWGNECEPLEHGVPVIKTNNLSYEGVIDFSEITYRDIELDKAQKNWLGNALKALEEQSDESIMGTDFEDEIGITQEEYDEIVESDGNFSRYDTDKYEYTVVIESHINHKLCCDTYYPKTQNWDDILACYHCEKEQLIEDVHEKTPYDQEEWMLDGYRPITRIECENGDWYDIFVAESEKQY